MASTPTAIPSLDRSIFPDAARDSFGRSVWQETAIAPEVYARLGGDARTDVVVVGAGYTGLSTALHLAVRGVAVTVLEAREPGFGASGRSGGQVVPLFKYEPDEIMARFGADEGRALLELVQRSGDEVFDLVQRYDLKCDARRAGWIQAAHGPNGSALVRTRHDQWAARGAPVRLLDQEALRELTGTAYYREGWLLEHAGTVNPLGYSRALARAASRAGAVVHGNTPVVGISRDGDRWHVRCAGGTVNAQTVVLAGNGYSTDLWPGLSKSIVPLYSMQVASDPLPERHRAQILPGEQAVADTRRLVWYLRRDPAGRFVLGARGPFKADPSRQDAAVLVSAARRLYPMLRDVDFPYVWSGRVAMTTDHIPHLHRLAPGVVAALGYNGRGVAMATVMGRVLAAMCVDEVGRRPAFPVTALAAIPLHRFHRLGVRALIAYYRLIDRFD